MKTKINFSPSVCWHPPKDTWSFQQHYCALAGRTAIKQRMIPPPPPQFLTEIDCNSQLCWNGQDYVSKSHFLSHNLPVPPAFNLWIGQYICILLSEKFESVTCIENLTILNNITFRARRRSSLTPPLYTICRQSILNKIFFFAGFIAADYRRQEAGKEASYFSFIHKT